MASRLVSSRRANSLSGRDWLRHSVSVWADLRKTPAESRVDYPAVFPEQLVVRVIRCFLPPGPGTILDPFCGSGSTLLAAAALGHTGVGFDLSQAAVALARARLASASLGGPQRPHRVIAADARMLAGHLPFDSIGLCVTSPPYWDVLRRRRTADGRPARDYGSLPGDLGGIVDYSAFVNRLADVLDEVRRVLQPGRYCVVNLMDLRKKDRFFPLHADLAAAAATRGWIFDDLIIWDRRAEYNNLRPLGYPAVFRINKVHEYLVILRKPLQELVS